MKFQHLCYNLKDIAPKKCRLNTSLGKPIDTMFATSDSLKVSAEAVCAGGAEAVVEAPELPGLDSLVSILWSEADLRTRMIFPRMQLREILGIPCKRLCQLFVFKTARLLGRSFQSCCFSFIACSSSRQPDEIGVRFWFWQLYCILHWSFCELFGIAIRLQKGN